MSRIKKILIGVILMILTSTLLTACNTVEGMGEDIESGGERIQDAAD